MSQKPDQTGRLQNLDPAKRELLLRALRKEPALDANAGAIRPRKGKADSRLSFAQQRLWFLDQLEPGGGAYNIPSAVRLKGALNLPALEQSLGQIINRHEVLRTKMELIEGEPRQVVLEAEAMRLQVVDLGVLPEEEMQKGVELVLGQELGRGFELNRGGLIRGKVVKIGARDHILVITMHHIVADGWSMGVAIRELVEMYASNIGGERAKLKDMELQYGDYAEWQRENLQGEELDKEVKYWKGQLEGAPSSIELLADRQEIPTQGDRAAVKWLTLPSDLSQALRDLSKAEGVTLFMTLLAGFKTLLHRYTGQEDIVVGTAIANRDRKEIESLIGFFVNTLVLRSDISSDPGFRKLLARVKDVTLQAYAHQHLPFEKLIEELRPDRTLGRTPLFQILFLFQNTPSQELQLPGLTLHPLTINNNSAEFNLMINITDTPDGIVTSLKYNQAAFDATTIERLANHFRIILQAVAADPDKPVSQLSLLSKGELHQLLVEWQAHEKYEDLCIHKMFEAQAELHPNAPAVSSGEIELSYGMLNAESNRVAHALIACDFGPNQPVGILTESGPLQVIFAIGVLKTGCFYVFLDPNHPASRLEQILEDIMPTCLIAGSNELNRHRQLFEEYSTRSSCQLIEVVAEVEELAPTISAEGGLSAFKHFPATNPSIEVDPASPAYVVFTSGSTGKPKGIVQPHRSFCQYIEWQSKQFHIGPSKRLSQWASITYDTSYAEIFGALCYGATICMTSHMIRSNPSTLVKWLRDEGICLLLSVPSFCRQILDVINSEDEHDRLPAFEYMLLAGEVLPVDLARAWLKRFPNGPELFNLYGPTECVLASYHKIDEVASDCRSITIGRAMGGRQLMVLDKGERPCPIGVKGEIYIRSEYLTLGYWNQPDETEKRFLLRNGFVGKLYRTGDLGRWLPDGNMEFFGRVDNLVKLRGVRIELEDIEATLISHPSIKEAVVQLREYSVFDQRLVAYFVTTEDLLIAELREFMREKLPEVMIPSVFVKLDTFPRTTSNKINRRALPDPVTENAELQQDYEPAVTETQILLADIWRDLLQVEKVGINDSFFDLGGHSLLATQLVNRVRNTCSTDIPLRAVFETPTIAGLAAKIDSVRESEQSDPDRLAQLLGQVNNLTDEEVKELIRQSQSPSEARP
ncbi:MAG: amino acid adenylation domain-containing protein [Blastocatellia bacterium]